jgi:hypothetical protein
MRTVVPVGPLVGHGPSNVNSFGAAVSVDHRLAEGIAIGRNRSPLDALRDAVGEEAATTELAMQRSVNVRGEPTSPFPRLAVGQKEVRNLVVRHPVPVVPDNDLLGTVEATDGDRRLDVHRLRVEGVPDQLGKDVDRARALHVPQDRVPARAYLLGLHRDSLRISECSARLRRARLVHPVTAPGMATVHRTRTARDCRYATSLERVLARPCLAADN